jgi:hypothetical protein
VSAGDAVSAELLLASRVLEEELLEPALLLWVVAAVGREQELGQEQAWKMEREKEDGRRCPAPVVET